MSYVSTSAVPIHTTIKSGNLNTVEEKECGGVFRTTIIRQNFQINFQK